MYLEGIKEFPKKQKSNLKTQKGNAFHVKTDVFKKTMWYSYPGESDLFSMTPTRVKEIIEMNRKGKIPANLQILKFKKNLRKMKKWVIQM